MTNKPKQKGTAAETAVVRYLRANGFPQADRAALHGSQDTGDITGIPDTVIEVKNCKQLQLNQWLEELRCEFYTARKLRGAWWGGLWVKKYGSTNPGNWPVYIPDYLMTPLHLFRPHLAIPVGAVVMIPGALFVQALHNAIREVDND
jgi:Holliday junction resolvase